jgi:putative peptidoglycan lipid II flippase
MNLLKAASTISLMSLGSRVLGLVREQLVAASFGASEWTDAFNVAFRIPNLLRRLFAEGAFAQAFVPLLAGTRAAEGDDATRRLMNAVATVLTWTLVATCVIGVVVAPAVVWLMASGLKDLGTATVMTRIMFPYIGFMSFVALTSGALNTWGEFAVPAATPMMLNVAMIAAAIWAAPFAEAHGYPGVYALAWGVMAGGILQAVVQWPALRRLDLVPRIGTSVAAVRAAWHHPGVHRVLKQMSPALLGVSVAQVSLLINTQIASHLHTGSVSWLNYADRLMEFPTALLGVALGVVLVPQLSARRASGDVEGYSGLIDWGLRLVLLLALPCSVALLVFAQPLLAVLYHYGRFSAADVAASAWPLQGYGMGLLGLIAVKVLAPGYFAQLDTRTPVRIAIGVLAATQAMNALFVYALGWGVGGLALSIGLGALLNASFLLWGLRQRGTYVPRPGWSAFGWRVAVAAAVLGGVLFAAAHGIDWIHLRAHPLERAGLMAAVLVGVAALYFAVLAALGMDLRSFARRGGGT